MSGLTELPPVANIEPFIPVHMDQPKLYPGDVIVGYDGREIVFAELIYNKLDDGVMVYELDTGLYRVIPDNVFSARLYKLDETHVYDNVTEERPNVSVSFDPSKLERPEPGRAR